ncbi:MAG: hypothetical protein J6O41_01190 [Clostridia bacterium]|nr:hypothetical protein [Clostridia bacterium]
MINIMENNVREKVNFIDVIKSFWKEDKPELDFEESMASSGLTEEEKKALLNGMKNVAKEEKRFETIKKQIKRKETNLKVNNKVKTIKREQIRKDEQEIERE